MVWLDGFSGLKTARERATTAFYAPLGMMSPLWIAFGAAASAGAAFWLMSRWTRPVNIEAARVSLDAAPSPVGQPLVEPVADALAEVEATLADDLTTLAGVGPKIAKALAERGVERFDQLAAWTQQDLAAFDKALNLRGRAIRSDFVAQARRLAAGDA